MKFDFWDRRSAERFAELLDEAGGARRHHTRGHADVELDRLVAIGNRLTAARPGAPVDSEFRVGLRAMLVATAERDGIGRTAADDEFDPVPEVADGARRSIFGRRIRARGAIVIGVAAGAMAVSGISAASESASPGDALYGVKRSTERAQLAIAGSDVTRGQLSLDFARNRLTEAVAMDGEDPAFGRVLDDMDADTRKGVRLLTTSAVAHKDTKPLTTLDGFVDGQRDAFAPALDGLSPANRDRALTSLALLEDVTGRTEALRNGVRCERITPAGSDELGPRLRDCAGDGQGSNAGSGTQQGHNGKGTNSKQDGRTAGPKPAKSGSTAEPDATNGVTAPGLGNSPMPGGKPAIGSVKPSPSGSTTTPVPADAEDGVLGGLLGDLF
ncbi:DUF5667 domain-containing protein [Actinoplanes aureus]|uniref:DUF5667 domain-containing protein n=1 Tax=Actinoplanes aureus TaxID=2792083 RepID=UPI0028160E50|nr:DUF5667 domain-containing protein [Actinoplanes aureus]